MLLKRPKDPSHAANIGLLSVAHPKSTVDYFFLSFLITLKKVLTFMSLCFQDIETDAAKNASFHSFSFFQPSFIHSLLLPLKAADPWNLPLNLPLLSPLICFLGNKKVQKFNWLPENKRFSLIIHHLLKNFGG